MIDDDTTNLAPRPFDNTALLAEIRQEVQRRRDTGELPPDLERDLDRAFAELAPIDALEADFETIVGKLQRSAVIDVHASTASAYPGAAQLKQAVAKATAFSMRHVADQSSTLFEGIARALRLLGDRLDGLEVALGQADRDRRQLAVELPVAAPRPAFAAVWDDLVLARLKEAGPGRVLHAHAGDGALVGRLVDAGYDAYGVDPFPASALPAAPDIRCGEAADHLASLPEAGLAALVLSGVVEQLDPAALLALVPLAASRLAPGGIVIVVSAHPGAWQRSGPALLVDLAPGRPVHPETWELLLRRAGLEGVTTEVGAVPELLDLSDPAQAACQENFTRLAGAVFCAADYATSARRPR